jgi:hypothetical protein
VKGDFSRPSPIISLFPNRIYPGSPSSVSSPAPRPASGA